MDGHVYVDIARSGEANMAIDRQLLQAAERLQCAFVRLYRWRTPTLSLGHFQATKSRAQHAASAHLPLVLRASGGGAIVHDREWTYSIALPMGRNEIGAATQLYDLIHAALVAGFRSLGWDARQWSPPLGAIVPINDSDFNGRPGAAIQGAAIQGVAHARGCRANTAKSAQPFLCFHRRSCGDIVCEGFKIVGSAQRRFGASVLQHGSILCAASRYAPELPGLGNLRRSDPTAASAGFSQNLTEGKALQGLPFAGSLISWLTEPLVQHLGIEARSASPDSIAGLIEGHHANRKTKGPPQ